MTKFEKKNLNIKIALFDIDGVITDGKKYINENGGETKTVTLKDLDALGMLKDLGYKLACVTGENTEFSRRIVHELPFDYVKLGCKNKVEVIGELRKLYCIEPSEICYVGDGKYDIELLQKVGLSICPNDAINEVKEVSDITLERSGGNGCIAEIYTILKNLEEKEKQPENNCVISPIIKRRILEHQEILDNLAKKEEYLKNIELACEYILNSYGKGCGLFLCGNGGSAADAQHLAAELVGRFYLERRALNAEALTVNSSVLTSLANDYDYDTIFARQLEAKARQGDVVIGITTSGTSKNILQAFQKAKEIGLKTILMTGDVEKYIEVLEYTDCLLAVPAKDTARIQEMHILTGHIICEIIEKRITKENNKREEI